MEKVNWGNSAISHEVSMPESTTQPMAAVSSGPFFDLTPHDPMMDMTMSPYGPPYETMSGDKKK